MMRDYGILVGATHLDHWNETNREVKLNRILVHEKYKPPSMDYDIALIHLSRSLTYSRAVSPVCLSAHTPPMNTICVATGWGETKSKMACTLFKIYKLGP